MFTSDDLKSIKTLFEEVVDTRIEKRLKTITTDIAAIQARTKHIEESQISALSFLEFRRVLLSVEKRMTAVEGKLDNFISKEDLKDFATKDDLAGLRLEMKSYVTKDDLKKELKKLEKRLENRAIKRTNILADKLDKLLDIPARVHRIETHLGFPNSS